METRNGTTIKATRGEAKHLSALLSPTRNFEPTDRRGEYFMEASGEVQALRDADFLSSQGAIVASVA